MTIRTDMDDRLDYTPPAEKGGSKEFNYLTPEIATPHASIYYGATKIPHPTNGAATEINAAKIMNQTMKAR